MNNLEQQSYTNNYYSNNYQDNSYRYSNKNYSNNYYNNGRNYPKSAPPNQHPFRYTTNQDEYHNSTYYPIEQQTTNNSHRSYQQNNSRRGCFSCGKPDHIKANCPSLNKTNSVHQQKTSS
jgi:hypothetical protein